MLAGGEKSRTDPRENVVLRAKVVDSRGMRDARISDISERGLLATMDEPPPRGEFINIAFPAREVAGQVRWVNGREFGVRLRERIDVASISDSRPRTRKAAAPVAVSAEETMTLKATIITYAVLGLTALSTAYLIVTYVIW